MIIILTTRRILSFAASSQRGTKARMVRIANEMSELVSSLPVEVGSSIFVRCDESRMDVIKALIIGALLFLLSLIYKELACLEEPLLNS